MVDLTKVFGGSFDTVDHPPEKPKDNIDPYSDFLNQLQAFGLKVDSLVEGKMTRCKMVDGKRGKKSGWYIFYPDHDISAGAFGDWRDPYNTQNWCSKSEREMTTSEISAYRARVALLKEQAEKERAEQAEKAAEEVTELLSSLPYAEPDQPYLKRKGVGSYGIYYSEKEKALIIPIRNVNGSARSVQRIYNNGGKYFHSGGEIPGNFHLIGSTLTEPTYIVEGYATGATIHEATGKAVVVAFNTGNLKPVIESLREAKNLQRLIICADNDRNNEKQNAGVVYAERAAEGQFGVSVVVPEFIGSEGTDFNDLFLQQGQEAVVDQVVSESPSKSRRFELTSFDDLGEPRATDWLIDGYTTNDSFSVVYGPSGHGKSFVILDMGMSIAAGKPWHGRKVETGAVIYICGEGRNGINKRLRAWHQENGKPEKIPFFVSNGPVMMLEREAVNEMKERVLEVAHNVNQPIKMIIIDTLNRNFGDGDENRTQDMTAFVNACTDIQHATGANVTVVHHTGLQDTQRARGSSALRAALDTEIAVEKTSDGLVRVKVTKQKDDDEAKPVCFGMKPVQIGFDDMGQPVQSVVLEPEIDPEGDEQMSKSLIGKMKANNTIANGLGGKQKVALRVIRAMKKEIADNMGEGYDIILEWSQCAEKMRMADIGTARRADIGDIKKAFIERGLLTEVDPMRVRLNDD